MALYEIACAPGEGGPSYRRCRAPGCKAPHRLQGGQAGRREAWRRQSAAVRGGERLDGADGEEQAEHRPRLDGRVVRSERRDVRRKRDIEAVVDSDVPNLGGGRGEGGASGDLSVKPPPPEALPHRCRPTAPFSAALPRRPSTEPHPSEHADAPVLQLGLTHPLDVEGAGEVERVEPLVASHAAVEGSRRIHEGQSLRLHAHRRRRRPPSAHSRQAGVEGEAVDREREHVCGGAERRRGIAGRAGVRRGADGRLQLAAK